MSRSVEYIGVMSVDELVGRRGKWDLIFSVLSALSVRSMIPQKLMGKVNMAYSRMMDLCGELVDKGFVFRRMLGKGRVEFEITSGGLLLLGFLRDLYELYFDVSLCNVSNRKVYDLRGMNGVI